VVHSDFMQLLHSKILVAIKRQDEIYVKNGQLKIAKIYANFSQLDDLTPTSLNDTLSFPTPDQLVTDNGIATVARAVFGSSDPNKFQDAENLSLYEDQPFLQHLFSPMKDSAYARIPTILLGYPFTMKTPEDVIHARLTAVVSAMVPGNFHTDRLVKNTLSSLQNINELSTRSSSKVQEILDFITQIPDLKKAYFQPIQEKLNAFNKRKFSDATDSKPAKRRLTSSQAP